jgi:Pyruvate/2-oxoacid:ferredoxin oxidoreductase delta subunit
MTNVRSIIKIDEEKCNGCALCIPNCPEGALQIIDGKARLISDLFCDGLGACIGHCPEGAITIEEREAEPYDEKKTMVNIVKHGENTILAHLIHLKEHGETDLLSQAVEYLEQNNIPVPSLEKPAPFPASGGCPGSQIMQFNQPTTEAEETAGPAMASQLTQWPIQIHLVPPNAPYFQDADLLVTADCVPFAYADFHRDLLKGKIVLVGCPKLDDPQFYIEKLTRIFASNNIKSITCAHMEVPCCLGLAHIIKTALENAGKDVPYEDVTIGIKGEKKS